MIQALIAGYRETDRYDLYTKRSSYFVQNAMKRSVVTTEYLRRDMEPLALI
jgi:hypothetical protein